MDDDTQSHPIFRDADVDVPITGIGETASWIYQDIIQKSIHLLSVSSTGSTDGADMNLSPISSSRAHRQLHCLCCRRRTSEQQLRERLCAEQP